MVYNILSLDYHEIFVMLLLEIAFQSASLTSLLKIANLYMERMEEGILQYIFPLNSFLKKLLEQSFQMEFEYDIVSKVL